ncbi:Transposon TX1 uncharacterized protein [Choanephora cucurbitarum]|uniref:Transposon TX1 uncharacterized protein n=1 Tax=Choanephora cucurbitarum TaxID=101091 RepID=A0A1C7MXH7_9FUNG|nr:Transposon TX1 uncharacterized protein [Choanephora cucurbitarum]
MSRSTIRIGSLNAPSIFKESHPELRKSFLTHLKSHSLSLGILCLQDVLSVQALSFTDTHQHEFRTYLFPNTSSHVTWRTVIICLNPTLTIKDFLTYLDGRCTFVSIVDALDRTVCSNLNFYIPPALGERILFFDSLRIEVPFFSLTHAATITSFILGNFNSNLKDLSFQNHVFVEPWMEWLNAHYTNCFPEALPTYTSAANHNTRKTIDYVFVDKPWMWIPSLHPRFIQLLTASENTFINQIDFEALHISVTSLPSTPPVLFVASNATKRHRVWESFKLLLQNVAKSYSRHSKARYQHILSRLQLERNDLLVSVSSAESYNGVYLPRLQQLDTAIEAVVDKETAQYSLRTATRWRGQGERNNKYFFRTSKHRQRQQTIQSLTDSNTGASITTTSGMLREARSFYTALYTPDPIDQSAVNELPDSIPQSVVLSDEDQHMLLDLFVDDDLLASFKHSPTGKSPGLDSILCDALQFSYTSSWNFTRMVLLFKKGDPTLLQNWRPLSLINVDAKIFMKLLANRFNLVLSELINPHQTGFMPNRLISDNGWLNHTLMATLRASKSLSPQVAVLLDTEKAYDRFHPGYLQQIQITVNGWLSAPVSQSKGLRQCDPLSPLLFNLAYEPLLRYILASSAFKGVGVPQLYPSKPLPCSPLDLHSRVRASPPVRLLAYADDLEIFLSSLSKWPSLLEVLVLYSRASDARTNISKTTVVSLNGAPSPEWSDLCHSVGFAWHDATSTDAVKLLGYSLYSSDVQLTRFLSRIRSKLFGHIHHIRLRGLSVRGLSVVVNSLAISRPRRQGGMSIVNIQDQASALQFICLKRLAADPEDDDFLTPWLLRFFQINTGHASVLPVLLKPSIFKHFFKFCPPMLQPLKLVGRLPALDLCESWSLPWLLDLHLSLVVTMHPTCLLPLPRIPNHYLVSDLLRFDNQMDILGASRAFIRSSRCSLLHLFDAIFLPSPTDTVACVLHPLIRNWCRLLPLSSDVPVASPFPTDSNTYLPSMSDWLIDVERRGPIAVFDVRLSQLRRWWAKDRQVLEIVSVATPPTSRFHALVAAFA